jgi:putative ABC transport system substrate-binding protein
MLRFRLWVRRWLLACLACLAGSALAHPVSVVSSDKTAAFTQATDSLLRELLRSGVPRADIHVMSTAEFLEGGPHMVEGRLIITLGADALRQVTSRSPRPAVLAGLIPRLSFERLLQDAGKRNAANVAALYLDQPFGRQLDLLRLALPGVRRVGVLWGPESVSQQPLLLAAAQARGLELSEGQHGEGQSLISALRSALADADVLLAVADGLVYNPASVSNILLTSYRAKTPVMAFSPAYVKAGALLSVHSTAAQAGAQLAAMAQQLLQSNTLPASRYPAEFSISANEYVARSLGLSVDEDALTERLRKQEKKP